MLVNHAGEVVEGTWPLNLAAFVIHSQIHAARPDVVSAAHAHSVHGKAWSSLQRPLDPLTQDACAFYGDHALFDDYTGAVLDTRGGQAHRPRRSGTARQPSWPTTACSPSAPRSTRRRGGSSPWSAPARPSCWPRRPETPVPIRHGVAKKTAGQTGITRHRAGCSFQPLYDRIVAGSRTCSTSRPGRSATCSPTRDPGSFRRGTARASWSSSCTPGRCRGTSWSYSPPRRSRCRRSRPRPGRRRSATAS